jgi:hypothetical protein
LNQEDLRVAQHPLDSLINVGLFGERFVPGVGGVGGFQAPGTPGNLDRF